MKQTERAGLRKISSRALLAFVVLALSACGGGGSSGEGDTAQSKSSNGASPTEATRPDIGAPGPGAGVAPPSNDVETVRRALDIVNPIDVDGEFDIEVSENLSRSISLNYQLFNLDGSTVDGAIVTELYGAGGSFFPRTGSLRKVRITDVAPGRYVFRVKGTYANATTHAFETRTADLQVELGTLSLHLASLSYSAGFIVNGSMRHVPYEVSVVADGVLYFYPLHQRSAICPTKSEIELKATAEVEIMQIVGKPDMVTSSGLNGSLFSDVDTLCAQFVRAADAVAEAPYTFQLRWVPAPPQGDALVLNLDAKAAAVSKAALSLVSLPRRSAGSAAFNWNERRQVFSSGDRPEQFTLTSSRATLSETGGNWSYVISAPTADDGPFYVAKIEGRPPMVFYVAD